jgi:hypothetical protein
LQYKVIASDPGNALFEGQTITPQYEDGNEIIIPSTMPGVMHHIKKNGEYFSNHLEVESK